MNAHIWELDKCENNNGKLLKNMVNENLQIMNCVWESMKGPTWFSENSEFTLDYICVDDCALKSVQSAYILETRCVTLIYYERIPRSHRYMYVFVKCICIKSHVQVCVYIHIFNYCL